MRLISAHCGFSELMVTMGFPKDEITNALEAQKYDEVMATYLLLGQKAPEVSIQGKGTVLINIRKFEFCAHLV